MPSRMNWTRQIWKQVRSLYADEQHRTDCTSTELDALALEGPDEEETSYLADLNKAPDFIDEAPVEVPEVRRYGVSYTCY